MLLSVDCRPVDGKSTGTQACSGSQADHSSTRAQVGFVYSDHSPAGPCPSATCARSRLGLESAAAKVGRAVPPMLKDEELLAKA
jgi:hypothetical protein